jgi:hypothetical protein
MTKYLSIEYSFKSTIYYINRTINYMRGILILFIFLSPARFVRFFQYFILSYLLNAKFNLFVLHLHTIECITAKSNFATYLV